MLEHIFGSKTRLKILGLFLKDPKKKYYIRQVARDTGSHLNAVRREVDNLLGLGILMLAKDSAQSLKKYVSANPDFVLYHELRALLVRSQLLVEEDFIKKIQSISNLSMIVLTGIFAGRNDAKTDILLVGNIDKRKLLSFIEKFEKVLRHNIRYTILTPSEYKYRKDVTDKFLYDILENKKIVILDAMQDAEKS